MKDQKTGRNRVLIILLVLVGVVLLVFFVSEVTGDSIKDWLIEKGLGIVKRTYQCNDHIDNDRDGYCDFAWRKAYCNDGSIPGDPACVSKNYNDESADCIPTCNNNSDCGVNGYKGEPYCGVDGNLYKDYFSYTCENAGKCSSVCNEQINSHIWQNCLGLGCSNGACGTCTDTCDSLGYECGLQLICGNNTNCGNCIVGICNSTGKCEEKVSVQAEYYVDVNLATDCSRTYSIINRDCSGSDGTAYNTIKEAANVAVAGNTVLVREGTYHETLTPTNSGNSGNLITFKAYPGEKPVIDGEYVRETVVLSGKNYIRVEGFEIRYSTLNGVYFKDSSGIEIINNNIHHNDNVDPAVNNYEGHSGIEMSGNINNILIKGNDIHHNYWNGITPFSLSISNLNIINNDIHNNGNDGIQQGGGSNWLIEGNKIRDQGGMPTAHPDGFQIFRPLNGLIIRRNIFYDHSQNIYMSGPLSDGFIENVEISYNIFYREDDPYAWPRATYIIDLGDGVKRGFRNVKIFGNTAYGLYFGFLVKGNITNYEIRDNILANIDNRCISVAEGAERSTSSNYNLFYDWGAIVWVEGTWYNSLSAYQTATGQDTNSVEANPQFIDAANYDFTPSAGSPACTMSSTGSYVGALPCAA